MAQNHLQFRRKPPLIRLHPAPAVVAGVQPKESWTSQQCKHLGHDHATISAENPDVLVAREFARSPLSQRWDVFDGIDTVEKAFHRGDHLAVVSSGLDQGL